MPIYEYRCPNGHTFEVFQKMTDPPPAGCPTCSACPVEKILFPVAVHFKGSGFYSTDYGKGARKAAAKDSDSSSTTDTPAEKAGAASDKASPDKPSTGKPGDGKPSSSD